MKKLFVTLAVIATLTGNAAFAQQQTGRGAAAAKNNANDDFAWGIGLVGLGVLATVIGLTAAAAAHNPSSHSH